MLIIVVGFVVKLIRVKVWKKSLGLRLKKSVTPTRYLLSIIFFTMTILIKTIVAAVDLDDDLAVVILETAADLAGIFDATLHVVDVVAPMHGFETLYAMKALAHDVESHKRAVAQRSDQLDRLVSEVMPSAKAIVVQGQAGEAVAEYAGEHNADLLVIGSHQKGWWDALTTGAASPELVRDAPCDVYVVTKEVARQVA